MTRRDPRGFTLVELCLVMVIASILLRFAVPAYRSIVNNARAVQAINNMNVVREAAVAYYAAHGTWPAEASSAVIPAGLAPYLPSGYTFSKPHYQLDWENWTLPSGLPSNPGPTVLIGVSVVTTDPLLGNQVLRLVSKSNPSLTSADHYTMLMASTSDGL